MKINLKNSKKKIGKKNLNESLFVRGEEESGFFCVCLGGGGAMEILKEERLFCFALFYRNITGKLLLGD